MNLRSRATAIAGTAALALATLGGVAVAQSPTAPAAPIGDPAAIDETGTSPAPQDREDENGEQDPALDGTVAVDETTLPDDDEAAEEQALADLPGVTVSAERAETAALDAVGSGSGSGSVTENELGNENGFAVWEVEVTASDGTTKEVKVDAGDGSVLATEDEESEGIEGPEDAEGTEGPEGAEAPEDEEAATPAK